MSKELIYGEKGDHSFGAKLMSLKEFQVYKTPPLEPITDIVAFEKHVDRACGGFEKTIYQHLMQHFVNIRSSHITRSLLLYHFLGVGKSCSAITISEALLLNQTDTNEPSIYVVAPSALHKNFEGELFSTLKYLQKEDLKSQCTGDVYKKLVYGIPKDDTTAFLNKVHKLIKTRYAFLTYADLKHLETQGVVKNKTFIVDEAHNLRQNETTKASSESLKHILTHGKNNKLVLLSATPMYNEPDEIFWLLSLMLRNEGRITLAESVEKMHLFNNKVANIDAFNALGELATQYISYIKGNNPFTFPARLNNDQLPYISDSWASGMRDRIIQTPVGKRQQFTNLKDTDVLNATEARDLDALENTMFDAAEATGAADEADEADADAADTSKLVSATQLQLSNITYTYAPGEKIHAGTKAFYKVFEKVDTNSPIQVKYRHGKLNALMPTDALLGEIAPKIKKIMDLIRTSEGIVVVYSQYVWSGIIPCAIALEHMGFARHGTRKMLAIDSKNVVPTLYKNGQTPSYAILTGAESIMGSTKIEDILPILNNPKNSDGSSIKLILMTPIAGEGLSFKNAREIHILEPWYHFNRTEQVIGRTVRTCSHKQLVPEERNVTVYLHACVQDTPPIEVPKKRGAKKTVGVPTVQNTISPDIHAYKIAARKLFETQKAEEVIRNNAIDCALLENLNYYPKNIFQMSVSMRTSQGNVISYTYGDDPSVQPKCTHTIPTANGTDVSDSRSMRSELFTNMLPTTTLLVEKYIQMHINQGKTSTLRSMYYFTIDELSEVIRKFANDDMIVYDTLLKCIHPNRLIKDWKLLPHLKGIIAIPHKTNSKSVKMVRLPLHTKTKVTHDDALDDAQDAKDADDAPEGANDKKQSKQHTKHTVQVIKETDTIINNIISHIPSNDPKDCIGIYNAYTMVHSLNWRNVAKYIVSLSNLSESYLRVAELYAKSGAFIKASEIPRLSAAHKGRLYIGFVDIFNMDQFDVNIIDPNTDTFRDATEAEVTLIKNKRREDAKPKVVTTIYGILEPTHNKKTADQLFTNQFKLIGTGAKGPVTRGAVCDHKPATEIDKYLNEPPLHMVLPENTNKNIRCLTLAIELMKHDLLYMYPVYKPKK